MAEQQKNSPIEPDISAYLGVRSPSDVQALDAREIPALCQKLRHVLVEQTKRTGGHLASNLGVVEMTAAIHRVFQAPVDHIVFDVGHQAYVHKLLTGRAEAFATLRTPGGLSGFPRRDESEYDAFGTGHASTSLSAALGLARAAKLSGSDAYTVVVLGDGALTGGMIHEALNNCENDLRLIVILNENEMSISKNEGRFARLLTKLRTSRGYSHTKSVLDKTLMHIPLVGEPMKQGLSRIKKGIITAITLRDKDRCITLSDTALVHFKALSDSEIEYYVDTYRPFDKAGAYGIQEWIGYMGIDKIEGSYFTIMGLPVHLVYQELVKFIG